MILKGMALPQSNPAPTPERNSSFWADDIGLSEKSETIVTNALPDRTGVVIVGAGYTGLSAALTLARAGQDVTVVDAGSIGFGCSARNGGHIGPSFHKLGAAGLAAEYGQEFANAVMRESLEALNWLKQFIQNENIDCDLQLVGRFKGASRPQHYDAIARDCENNARITDFQYQMIPQKDQHLYTGSPTFYGGVVLLDDGLLHPAKYVLGLAERAVRAGAQIIAPAKVDTIHRTTNGFDVHVGRHRIKSDKVLIATNGYTGPEFPHFHRRVMPLRSAIIATEDIGKDAVSACFPKGQGTVETSRLVLYPRPSPDGRRVLFGGRAFDLSDRPANYIADLSRLMTRMFPQLGSPEISHAWSGTVAYTFDHAPHIGCHDGIHFAMGYCGSGVGRASFFGHKIALKMLGEGAGKTALDGLNFPTKPFYRGRPWFLPALLRYHNLMDRVGR